MEEVLQFNGAKKDKASLDLRHLARWAYFVALLVGSLVLLVSAAKAETQYAGVTQQRVRYVNRPDVATDIAVLHQQVDQNTANIQLIWKTMAERVRDDDEHQRAQDADLNRIKGFGAAFLGILAALQYFGLKKKA